VYLVREHGYDRNLGVALVTAPPDVASFDFRWHAELRHVSTGS
jgi:hypothetical protein